MDRRVLGGGLLALALLLWLALHLLAPLPSSLFSLREEVEARGALPASEGRLVAWGGVVHSYNATRDQTLVIVAYCSHSPCGPGVWLEGDLRGRLPEGPWLLVPEGEVRVEEVGPPTEPILGPTGRPDVQRAFTPVFDVRPVGPTFLGHASALALGLAGLALLAPWLTWRQSGALVAAGLVGVLLGSRARGAWFLLIGISLLLLAPGGLAALATALVGIVRRKPRAVAWGAGVVLFVAGLLGAGFLAGHLYPDSGVGD